MRQLIVGGSLALGLAMAACSGTTGTPAAPSALSTATVGSGAASGFSTQAQGSVGTGVARAVANCQGSVLDVLRGVFASSSTPIVISDNGGTIALSFNNPGRSFSLAVTYIDRDASGTLTCGDLITGVV